MGWPRPGWVRGHRPGRSPTAHWVPRSQPQLPAGRASFPNMVCSLLDGALTLPGRRDVQPTLPQRVTPEHGATPLGPLSPCPMTTGSASRVSHRKTPPAQGGGCRQGHAQGHPPPRRRAARGAGRGASGSAGLSGGWRVPPRARASGKNGQGGREGLAPGGRPGSYRGTVQHVDA